MSSVVVTIVDGVRDLLQTRSDAGGFIRAITPQRAYVTTVDLTDDSLHVHVLHGDVEVGAADRTRVQYTVPVTIAVRKKFDGAELDPNSGFGARDEVDQLIELSEQIAEYVNKKVLTTPSGAASAGPATFVAMAPENKFQELQQFYGVVRVNFIHVKSAS